MGSLANSVKNIGNGVSKLTHGVGKGLKVGSVAGSNSFGIRKYNMNSY